MHRRTGYAVSELIGIIYVLIIITSIVGATLIWALPYMDDKKASVRTESVLHQLEMMGDVLYDLVHQGEGSCQAVNVVTDAGTVDLSSEGTRFILYYSVNESFDFNVIGFDDENDNEFTFIYPCDPGSNYVFWFNVTYLTTGSIENIPKDIVGGSPYYDITLNELSLRDAVKIDIVNASAGRKLIGRIWLFDSGSLTYEISSPSSTRQVVAENGGIITVQQDNGYLFREPVLYNEGDVLVMRMIQFKPGSTTSAGGVGKATYRFTMEMNTSCIRENKIDIPSCFKLQILKEYSSSWITYLTSQQGFSSGEVEGTLYLCLQGERTFSLAHSVCDLELEVFG